jgi:hypothetical protein
MHLLPRRLLLLTTARIFERKIVPAPKYMDLTKRNGCFFQHNKRFLWEKNGDNMGFFAPVIPVVDLSASRVMRSQWFPEVSSSPPGR